MADQPKPSAEALATADAICKRHGMLPGGYMRDSLAEDLEAFAEQRHGSIRAVRERIEQRRDIGVIPPEGPVVMMSEAQHATYLRDMDSALRLAGVPEHIQDEDWTAEYQRLCQAYPDPPVATMLGVPITVAERDRISKDGP